MYDVLLPPPCNWVVDGAYLTSYIHYVCQLLLRVWLPFCILTFADGSSWYLNHHNLEVYGGHKSDFGGHSKFTYNSIHAYANCKLLWSQSHLLFVSVTCQSSFGVVQVPARIYSLLSLCVSGISGNVFDMSIGYGWGSCTCMWNSFVPGYQDGYYDNTCVQAVQVSLTACYAYSHHIHAVIAHTYTVQK